VSDCEDIDYVLKVQVFTAEQEAEVKKQIGGFFEETLIGTCSSFEGYFHAFFPDFLCEFHWSASQQSTGIAFCQRIWLSLI
jgi:hypothetical protein